MLSTAASGLRRILGLDMRRAEAPRRMADSTTATMRALTDVGESIVSGVHVIYSQVRLYLCVSMEPKPDALERQMLEDRRVAAGMFEVDRLWSAAAVNARWAKNAVLTDGEGNVIERAVSGARGLTDAGAREVFFEYNAMEGYPQEMYLAAGDARVRVR